MSTLYQIGRLGKLPGVEMTPWLHPTRIPVRTRNAIKRMITGGYLQGGWSSTSRRLAEVLNKEFALPYVSNGHGVEIPYETSKAIRERIAEMYCADHMAFVVINSGSSKELTAQYQRNREFILNPNIRHHGRIQFRSSEVQRQVAELIGRELAVTGTSTRQHVCQLLDGSNPIQLSIESTPR